MRPASLLALLLVACAATRPTSGEPIAASTAIRKAIPPAAAPALPSVPRGGVHRVTVDGRGEQRFAYVHVPRDYDPATPTPTILVFHGGKGSSTAAQNFSRTWASMYDQGMILVFPNGQDRDREETAWISRDARDTRDVDHVRALLSHLGQSYNIDPERMYAAGFSNGGIMTIMLACHAPEMFAGFAVFSQTVHKHIAADCTPTIRRPVLYLAGTAEKHWPGRHFSHSAMETVAWWRDELDCPLQPTSIETLPDGPDRTSVQRSIWAPCGKAAAFEFLRVENGAHFWPGPGLAPAAGRCTDIDGATEVRRFFQAYAGL
ncbi:MAG: polyhydroxybutyrate depolymerase [Myxococcota bacterium]|jgi:polyhydroxybutyrate depolymerase